MDRDRPSDWGEGGGNSPPPSSSSFLRPLCPVFALARSHVAPSTLFSFFFTPLINHVFVRADDLPYFDRLFIRPTDPPSIIFTVSHVSALSTIHTDSIALMYLPHRPTVILGDAGDSEGVQCVPHSVGVG